MSCCGGRPCGGYRPEPDATLEHFSSRYPKLGLQKDAWAVAATGLPQFDEYNDGLEVLQEGDTAPFVYTGEHLRACNFPLGGFGCGHVLLCGDGTLKDWTVVNQCRKADGGPWDAPAPLHCMPSNWFAVSATVQGQAKQTYALISPQNYTETTTALPPGQEAHVSQHEVCRLQTIPGIKALTMRCRYPIADVAYDIPGFPVHMSLEAMTPAIPLDSKASCIPVAVFQFSLKNTGSVPVEVSVMQAQQNFVGWDGFVDCTRAHTSFWGGNVNTPFQTEAVGGLSMTSTSVASSTPDTYGTIAIAGVAAPGVNVEVISQAANEQDLYAKFQAGALQPTTASPTPPSADGTSYCGAVVQTVTVPAGGSQTVDFYLCWHFPNRSRSRSAPGKPYEKLLPSILGNYYGNLFGNARDVAVSVHRRIEYLRGATRAYVDALYGSTIPPDLLDSAAGRLAVMRSPTMWWTQDGIVMGTEGNGCCPLNCTHVYGYTTLLERLFPDLAMDMAYSNFVRNYDPAHGATMRFGTGSWAIDGALACVIKSYLCVRQGDPELKWLPRVWPNIKAQMELLYNKFDDGTGVIRIAQQNTYDSAMFGANTFIGSYWVTGLKAAAAMAALMGDAPTAQKYRERAGAAAQHYETICWREDFGYYVADVTEKNCRSSYGPGCFVDQLCGIGLSSACGFGHIFQPDHEARARDAIRKYNKVTQPMDKRRPVDGQNHFFPGDSGITVCTYPHGKLKDGMTYATLVSSGFASPVVAGMLLDRNVAGALEIAGNVRKRHDGRHRSPWNEPECGLLYSRAMAHWNIYDQACGHTYDSVTAALSFDPRSNASNFKCFFILAEGWGNFSQTGPAGLPSGELQLSVLWGKIHLKSLQVVSSAKSASASAGGQPVPACLNNGVVTFGNGGLSLSEGAQLCITLVGGASIPVPPLTAAAALRLRQVSAAALSNGLPADACKCSVEPSGGALKGSSSARRGLSTMQIAIGALLVFFMGLVLGPRAHALLVALGQSRFA